MNEKRDYVVPEIAAPTEASGAGKCAYVTEQAEPPCQCEGGCEHGTEPDEALCIWCRRSGCNPHA